MALDLLERHELDLRGCDPDPEAIAWLRRAAPDGDERFRVSGFKPPLPYEDASFDVLYGVSIVTHLSEPDQRIWLTELARVVEPDGIAILTTAGPHAFANPNWAAMPRWTAEKLAGQLGQLDERGGFLFVSHSEDFANAPDKWPGISGDYGLTFQNEAWIRANWVKDFEVRAVVPRALGHQDAVVVTPRG